MKYKGIPDLYLINGKIVFRKHIMKNGREFNIWKTIGRPEDFTEEELRRVVLKLRKEVYEKLFSSSGGVQREGSAGEGVRGEPVVSGYREKVSVGGLKGPTLGEMIERFFRWYRVVRKRSTWEVEFRRVRNLLKFFGENFIFTEIGMKEVEEYRIWRLSEGADRNTVNKDLRLLSMMINRAVEFEWIPGHRLYKKSILIKGVRNERVRYLSREEERRLMEVLESGGNSVLRDIVIVALNTGMRLGEILDLRWENVDFRNRVIVLFPEQTKNGRRHIIPVNEIVYRTLKERERLKVPGCPHVFHRNGRKIRSIREGFRNALRKAGIDDFRFHDLRHTFASRLVQMGVDLYVVKELLNHSSITVTQRYAHLRLENVKRAVEMLEK